MKIAALLLAVVFAATPLFSQPADAGSGAIQASENYTIVPLDLLRFRVVGEDDTMTEVRVANDGSVTLPFVGTVKISGLTVAQAREHLYKLYDADYYVDPQIDLTVIGYKQRRVNVQGMVNQQGIVVFPPEETLTLLGAISAAGGWRNDRMANPRDVELIRKMPDGTMKTYIIDATRISQEDWALQDGDFIKVPERRI